MKNVESKVGKMSTDPANDMRRIWMHRVSRRKKIIELNEIDVRNYELYQRLTNAKGNVPQVVVVNEQGEVI